MDVTGKRVMTITATAGTTYVITWPQALYISIYNNTDGDIQIDDNGQFVASGNIANYVTVPSGAYINDVSIVGSKICIKALAAGNIVITLNE